MIPSELFTQRLIIGPLDPKQPSDYNRILSVYNSPYIVSGSGDLGLHTAADGDKRCKELALSPSVCTKSPSTPTHVYHLIYLRTTSEFIGHIGMAHRPPKDGAPDPGWTILEPFHGPGYATEAAREVLRWYQDIIGVPRFTVDVQVHYLTSRRVAENCGFVAVRSIEEGQTASYVYPLELLSFRRRLGVL